MDMNIFKETVKRHSIRLKEEEFEVNFNKAITSAQYYSDSSMNEIDNVIKTFKEKASKGCTEVLYNEGIKDIGKAIWTAIINMGKAIVRIAINVKMMFIGGENGLVKRLNVIKEKVKSMGDKGISIVLPVKKGGKGVKECGELMHILLDLSSGNAFLNTNISPNGELKWDIETNDEHRKERVAKFKSLQSTYALGRVFGSGALSLFVKEVQQDGSFLDVFAAPSRLYNIALGAEHTLTDALLGNKADLDAIEKFVNNVRTSVAKGGVAAQIMKRLGVRGSEGKLKGIMDYVTMNGASKGDILSAIDDILKIIHNTFETTKKGKGLQATTYNFEDCMRHLIKDVTAVTKQVGRKSKESDKGDAEVMTRVQSISKASTTVMNVVLKDYMNMAGSIKLMLNEAIKKMSGSLSEGGKSAKDTGKTDITSIPYFKDCVSKKDDFGVKSVLADMISRTKGDKGELDKAISYAESKGAFTWDKYDSKEATTKWENRQEEFNFEKGRLVQNFSKERYGKVLKLYQQ